MFYKAGVFISKLEMAEEQYWKSAKSYNRGVRLLIINLYFEYIIIKIFQMKALYVLHRISSKFIIMKTIETLDISDNVNITMYVCILQCMYVYYNVSI